MSEPYPSPDSAPASPGRRGFSFPGPGLYRSEPGVVPRGLWIKEANAAMA